MAATACFFLKSTTLKDMPVVGAENELGCQTAFGDDKKLCSSEKKRAPVLEHLQDFSQSKSIELPGNLVENESNVYSCENSPTARKLLEIYTDKGVSFLVCADNASPSFIYYMRYENCFLQDVNALKYVASFLINIANAGGDTPVELYTYSNPGDTSRESQNINDYLAQLESREIPKKIVAKPIEKSDSDSSIASNNQQEVGLDRSPSMSYHSTPPASPEDPERRYSQSPKTSNTCCLNTLCAVSVPIIGLLLLASGGAALYFGATAVGYLSYGAGGFLLTGHMFATCNAYLDSRISSVEYRSRQMTPNN